MQGGGQAATAALRSITRREFDAVLFDLDGVVTATARLHAEAWKATFDEVLARLAAERGEPFAPFDAERDYLDFVDGKPRDDGVRDFLGSRAIHLPEGGPDEPEGVDTVQGIGHRKNDLVRRLIAEGRVEVFVDAVAWLDRLDETGFKTAIVSSSRNAPEVLRAVGLLARFGVIVDGNVADELGLAGKPSPEPFLAAARRLEVVPARAVVVEDARSGVAAGRAGGFGYVLGVCRDGCHGALVEAGADAEVEDLFATSERTGF